MSDLDLLLRRDNAQRLVMELLQHRQDNLHIVDLGCGAGDGLDGLPRDRMHVRGLDQVPEMVEEAARNHPEDEYIVGVIEDLPFEDASSDVVLCLGVLEYLESPVNALQEMLRVLRPGGHAIISFPNRRSVFRILTKHLSSAEHFVGSLLRKLRGQPPTREQGTSYIHRQWSLREVDQLLQETGFCVNKRVFNTFGMWGRLGRLPISIATSKWMSGQLRYSAHVGSWCAHTMVFLAAKPKQRNGS